MDFLENVIINYSHLITWYERAIAATNIASHDVYSISLELKTLRSKLPRTYFNFFLNVAQNLEKTMNFRTSCFNKLKIGTWNM